MSSERVFDHQGKPCGLEIKYSKLTASDNSTLMIGDILASGDTLAKCMEHVVDFYKTQGLRLRNVIFFTIGGTRGIELVEDLTQKIRKEFPEFEGFLMVYYEGVFSCYEPGDIGVSGINRPLIDFIWRDGILAPEFRESALSEKYSLLEKCIIYDGGARRFEIKEHVDEILEFWNGLLERAESIDYGALLCEKSGYERPISYEDWLKVCHYGKLAESVTRELYLTEQKALEAYGSQNLKEIAKARICEFEKAMKKYIY